MLRAFGFESLFFGVWPWGLGFGRKKFLWSGDLGPYRFFWVWGLAFGFGLRIFGLKASGLTALGLGLNAFGLSRVGSSKCMYTFGTKEPLAFATILEFCKKIFVLFIKTF